MPTQTFPFAIRLIGFSTQEEKAFDVSFAEWKRKKYAYCRLEEDNLQDPDLYVANADELKALVALVDLRPSEIRPALLIGSPTVDLPYPCVTRPIEWDAVFKVLDELIEKRADALARLEASDIVKVPERRRRVRLDLDLTDPAEYEKMRTKRPRDGAVLVVDKAPSLRDYLSDLLARYQVPVIWVSDEAEAMKRCRQGEIAFVMINTSTSGVKPYRLCQAIKEMASPVKITVIFLVSKPFIYDMQQARRAGADGFLNKPLASHHLITVLKKFLSFSR